MAKGIKEKMVNLWVLATHATTPQNEADNALRALRKLEKKHSLLIDDIIAEKSELSLVYFNYANNHEKQLIRQIILYVVSPTTEYDFWIKKVDGRKVKKLGFELTEMQEYRISALIKIHKANLKEHFNKMFSAYIQANKLYNHNDEPEYIDSDTYHAQQQLMQSVIVPIDEERTLESPR